MSFAASSLNFAFAMFDAILKRQMKYCKSHGQWRTTGLRINFYERDITVTFIDRYIDDTVSMTQKSQSRNWMMFSVEKGGNMVKTIIIF